MKTIGLIGGMSWESSLEYYRIINKTVKELLGGFHSAKILLYSVDFEEIERYQQHGDWAGAAGVMIDAARRLERGGADFIVICTNTMHKLAQAVQEAVNIPLLHIADATAERICEEGIQTIGLLGTNYTMEQDFYKGHLEEEFELRVLIPGDADRQVVHRVIYDELCLGQVKESSRKAYKSIMQKLVDNGAEGIILGCTEISLLVRPEDTEVPQFDTTRIHALAAVDRALEE